MSHPFLARLKECEPLPLILPLALFGVLVGVAFGRPSPDDAWITYRVAENLATGAGFVYNAGERVLVATSPLQTLTLAVLGRLGLDVALAATAVGIAAAAGGGVLLYLIGRREHPTVGIVGGLFYSAYPFLPTVYSMETPLELCLALGAVYCYLEGRIRWAAVLLGLATLTRMDVVLLAAVLAAHWVWERRTAPLVPLAIYASVLAPWFAFSVLYFGSPFPATLAVKVAQGQQGWEKYLPGAADQFLATITDEPGLLMAPFFALIGLVLGLRRAWLVPIMGWAAAHALGYQLLGASYYQWYWGPLLPTLALGVGLGVEAGRHRLERLAGPLAAGVAAAALAGVVLVGGIHKQAGWRNFVDPGIAAQEGAGKWIDAQASATAEVSTAEMGRIGFYSRRAIADFYGLARPDVLPHAEDGFRWVVANRVPEYVVLTEQQRAEATFPEFRTRYAEAYVARPAGTPLYVYRLVGSEHLVQVHGESLGLTFGSTARLESTDVSSVAGPEGVEIDVVVGWRPAADWGPGYSSFVHLRDASWQVYAQSDHWREDTFWQSGSIREDAHVVRLPTGLAAGPYLLDVGVYRRSPYEPLVVEAASGSTHSFTVATVDMRPGARGS